MSRTFQEVLAEAKQENGFLAGCEEKVKGAIERLGELLLELQPLYYKEMGCPNPDHASSCGTWLKWRGKERFSIWAAHEFNRAPATIRCYMEWVRNPGPMKRAERSRTEAYRLGRAVRKTGLTVEEVSQAASILRSVQGERHADSSVRIDPLARIKAAYRMLPPPQQDEFLDWLNEELAEMPLAAE